VLKTAVARRYAKALLGLLDSSQIDATGEGLASIAAAVDENDALNHVLASPAFAFAEKHAVLASLGQHLGCPPVFNDFLAQLVKKNRLAFLPEIAEEFKRLADEHKGAKQVAIISAQALSEADRGGLRTRLRDLLRRDIDVTFDTDPRLLAGITIRIGSTVIDSTVRARLTAMRTLVTKE
jgi:F-type H+-transporting ATPase subunit delta